MDALLAGSSPRRATYFSLLRQRKVGKRKATPLAATLRFAAGKLRCTRAGCAVELAARLRRSVQTTPASQITKRMHAALHPRTPPAALLGASRGEGEPARAITALGPAGYGVLWERACPRWLHSDQTPNRGQARSYMDFKPDRLPVAIQQAQAAIVSGGPPPHPSPLPRAGEGKTRPSAAMARMDFNAPLAVPRSAGRGAGAAAQHATLRALTRCRCLNGARSAQ